MHSSELPSLMHVRAYVRVADYGSVSKASEALFRAQSVVTRSISELETRLGVLLFERHANGMRLTDYGTRLLPRARRVLAELDSVPQLLDGADKARTEPLYLFQARRLQVFVKLCETHHMQTVASLLGLSQPAISSTLKVLESGCGQTLFERTPRGLLPTRASLDILFPVRRALNELRHIDTDISALQGTLQGVVQVGALPLGRTRILPEAIVRLMREHPAIQVITNESPFDLLATELRAGDVDFIFGALRSTAYASDLSGEALLTEEMVVLARRGHPLYSKSTVQAELADAQWVLPRAGSPAVYARRLFCGIWHCAAAPDGRERRHGDHPWFAAALGHACGGVRTPAGGRNCQWRAVHPAAGVAPYLSRHRPHLTHRQPALAGGKGVDGRDPSGDPGAAP